jgi:hypothetical protein
MHKYLKLAMILLASFAFIAVNLVDANAAGRKGSKRVHPTAKGSHYVGGVTSVKNKTDPK